MDATTPMANVGAAFLAAGPSPKAPIIAPSSGSSGAGGAVAGAQVESQPSSSVCAFSTFASAMLAGAAVSQRRAGRAQRVARRQQASLLSEIKPWTGLTPGKEYRLQTMTVEKIAADTSSIRSLDWDRDRFDIEFALEKGTTYNSYVIKGAEKTALVDTSHEKFEELFMNSLASQADLATLDYLVVSHTEPDHSGLVARVLKDAAAAGNESLTVVGSKVCIQFLENLCFTPFKKKVVANNDKIDLGGGHVLEFVIAPNLHWPDTMFTFDHATGVLYTCDAFGMHYCSDSVVDTEGVQELLPHYALYYDCLMKPNARSVLTALKKTSGLDFHTIATGHGPILKESTTEWVDKYRTWSEAANQSLGPSVGVFWVSNFGQSERLTQVFAYGVTSSGAAVEMFDLNAVDVHEITECLARNDVIIVSAIPQGDGAAASALATIRAGLKTKKHRVAVLDSCGGDEQEPVDLILNRLLETGVDTAFPALKLQTQDGVTAQTLQAYEESGLALGKGLTSKAKAAASAKTDKDLAQALGRLSSALYIVTAEKAGVRHAMVASWVTPASESPMGISLVVAKDRAMEPLLRVGDSFVLNTLEEGKPATLQLTKHFLKRFAPGEDRLVGVDSFPSSDSGAAVLRDACAYLDCKIVSRMDASDHWVCYAEVTSGNVANARAVAAVHHRKTGTFY